MPTRRLKTHCPQGHPYDEANTYQHPGGYRVCRTCKRAQALARFDNPAVLHRQRVYNRQRRRAETAAKKAGRPASDWRAFFVPAPDRDEIPEYVRPMGKRTHCINGHEFTPENTMIVKKDGSRRCRTCKNQQQADRLAAHPEVVERRRAQGRERYLRCGLDASSPAA